MTVTSSFQINAKPGMLYSIFPLWSISYVIQNLHVMYRFQGAGCIGSTLEQDLPANTPELIQREKGHFIVFDDDLFGFLWISSKKFSLFHRVQDPSLQVLKKNWISLRDFVQVILNFYQMRHCNLNIYDPSNTKDETLIQIYIFI